MEGGPSPDHPVAFFCAEYGVHQSLPVYSGGLGALAGDFLKEASDRALPMVAVGLMYRQGYFRQRVDVTGWQQEYWVDTDPERLPAALVTRDGREPLTVTVPIRGHDVTAQMWRVDVGRVRLFLLDTDRPENDPVDRWITARLYVGDPVMRLAQYALLGLGGVKALDALGIDPGVVHLNEGHAAFAALQLASARNGGGTLRDALEHARRRTIFTTHTPVPAGNDTYPAWEVGETFGAVTAAMGHDASAIVELGRTHPGDEAEPFGVTQFALRTSRGANAVSRRHGEVARGMWRALWPERGVDDVPITHVTNGVHIPTWLGGPMRGLLCRRLGEGWLERSDDPEAWAGVEHITDEELWHVRREQRAELVRYVQARSVVHRLARGEGREFVDAAARAFDPDVLTVGFARRVATYKRLHLLIQDPERSLRLISGGRPIQFVLAGKAHPRDDEAKHLIQRMFGLRGSPQAGARVVFLEDYDLGVAAQMVRGCDVWVNVPRPPLEASGTSGMKSAVNGGLQLSVLDGWWAEGYDGENGWAISGDEDHDHWAQDARDGDALFRLLEDEVVPSFYDRGDGGLPAAWLARIRTSLRTNGPQFSATRMLHDYVRRLYVPA